MGQFGIYNGLPISKRICQRLLRRSQVDAIYAAILYGRFSTTGNGSRVMIGDTALFMWISIQPSAHPRRRSIGMRRLFGPVPFERKTRASTEMASSVLARASADTRKLCIPTLK